MTIPADFTIEQRSYAHSPRTLTAGTSIVLDLRGVGAITIITSAGATATISRVNSAAAVADSTDTAANQSFSANTRTKVGVDWPYFRVTAAGGSVRVGLA